MARTAIIAVIIAVAGCLGGMAWAQTIPPGDEAALYAAAQKEGTLVVYESGPLEAYRAETDDFEKKYPGIKVQLLRIVGVAQYQRFLQETAARQYIADVLAISDEPSMADLVATGNIAEWKVPSFDQIPPDMRIKTNAYAPALNDNTIVYNTNKVSAEEAKLLADGGWSALLDPRFKGRIALTTQKCGACYSAEHMFLDPKFESRFGVNYLKSLAAQKPALYNDIVAVVDRVIAGESDIGVWPAEGLSLIKWQAGAPIHWLHPKPSPVFGGDWMGVSQFAPHPNAARLFESWFTGPAGAASIQQRYGSMTTLTSVPDQRKVRSEGWYQPITDRYVPDWTRWSQDYDKDMNMWAGLLKAAK